MHAIRSAQAGASPARRVDLVAALALVAPCLAPLLLPAMAQPQAYHAFADQRLVWGLPHALNVLSNLPFALVGALGLRALLKGTVDPRVAIPYTLLFVGATLTAVGSAWYHLDPDDASLVWDRLPIALSFAGLVAGTLADRSPRRAPILTAAFAIVGTGSVLAWAVGANLGPYIVMQAGFIGAALYATARIPSVFPQARRLYGAAALYGLALACERLDAATYDRLGGLVSGHTLKHLLAAAALYAVYRMLIVRGRSVAGAA